MRSRTSCADSTGVLPTLTECLGPRTDAARIDRQHLADHEPVEKCAQCGQSLLHGLRRQAQLVDVGGDVHGLDRTHVEDAVSTAPTREVRSGLGVRLAGVRVSDVRGEELDGAAPGFGIRGVERRQSRRERFGASEIEHV
jgi:hypothetical protein